MTIKQLGGVFGRNPTFNDVTIEGELTFNGDIDVGSDLKVDGDLEVTGTIAVGNSSAGAMIDVRTDAGEYALRLENASGGYFRVADGGLTEVGGNVKFTNAGSGIDFSATAGTGTSELFDDYEEGTWTPVVADAASGGNEASYASNTGFYTKIGRQVFLTIRFVNINTSGMTAGNQIFITGLPFSSANDTRATVAAAVLPVLVSSTAGNLVAAMGPNTTALSLSNVTTSGSSNALVSQITSGSGDLFINVQYVAA